MIIGLVGKKRSGKDTTADYLVKKHNFEKYSLADPMKKAVQEIFLMSDEQLWGDKKEEIDFRYNTTPRKILQVFGTELFQYDIYRHIPELKEKIEPRKLWIERFKKWYERRFNEKWLNCTSSSFTRKTKDDDLNVVLSDVRFPHEAEEIKEMGGIIIRIYRSGSNDDSHASEVEMEKISHDYVIFNHGTKDDLYKNIDKLMSDILWKNLYIDS